MSVAKARSRLAVESKNHKREGTTASAEAVQEARRVLAEEKIREFVERAIAAAPPLSESARLRLKTIINQQGVT